MPSATASPPPPEEPGGIFSLRIVSLDYYMAPPIPGLDFSYSSFQGRDVEEVPVIRIYGPTPAGQKACLHVHRALPYLYVPCPDILLENQEGRAYIDHLSRAIEKALRNKGASASRKQHVHGCNTVRAKKLYGYHSSEELFVKIYLYYPHDVSRLAALLLGGAILNRSFQPYEAHIPYLLQFLVDYNLYGMGHIHTSTFKFRSPLPDDFISKMICLKKHDIREDSTSDAVEHSAVWLSSTVPGDLKWPVLPTGHDQVDLVKRQSVCSLELDTGVEDILNQKYKMYTSLSQARSEMKMVQSLAPIWEEYERSGMQDLEMSPDIRRPTPQSTLSNYLHGLEHEKALSELCVEIANSSPSKASAPEGAENFDKCSEISTDIGKAIELPEHCEPKSPVGTLKCVGSASEEKVSAPYGKLMKMPKDDECLTRYGNICQVQGLASTGRKMLSPKKLESPGSKSLDAEAIGILSWLASSQAMEDLSSDDELVHQAILGPMFPTKSYEKALEVAHLGYENASQQECQDILDTIENVMNPEGLKGEVSCGIVTPQVDGLSDEHCQTPHQHESSDNIIDGGRNNTTLYQEGTHTARRNSKYRRNKLLWGALPLSKNQKFHEASGSVSPYPAFDDELKNDSESSSSSGKKIVKSNTCSEVDVISGENVRQSLTRCSLRDLMRKKRCLQAELPESRSHSVGPSSEMQKNEETAVHLEGSINPTLEKGTKALNSHFLGDHIADQGLHELQISGLLNTNENRSMHIIDEDTNNQSGNIAAGMLHEMHLQSHVGPNSALDASALRSRYKEGEKWDLGTSSYESDLDFCSGFQREISCGEYVQMIFKAKPPSKDDLDGIVEDTLATAAPTESATGFHGSLAFDPGSDSEGQGTIYALPFFEKNFEDTKLEHRGSHQDFTLGVPTHFQNDGSALYILTYAFSPPTASHVHRWLSEELQKRQSSDTVGEESCGILPKSTQDKNLEAEKCSSPNDSGFSDPHLLDANVKGKALSDGCRAISQISGPDNRSNLTPLSQIGFRDPASDGGGQQLTLLSIEVLAESRGDLRPDPRFDPINVIAVAVQEDSNHACQIYVLERGSEERSYRRNVDGVSDCKYVILFDEKQLLRYFVKIVSELDPDIVIGWEIQRASLGFIAQRAGHLGVPLLENISRTPSFELKLKDMNSSDPGVGFPDNLPPEASIFDADLRNTIIEDEWGRTHASGIHVGGRIVLNAWRLMRSEAKLSMYTAEAVAEEVLRRKVPSFSFRVLNNWFSSGPGRARYRCLQYIIEKAKLNFQIMSQLDMVNRTSELARVFGIDFFSVLSRGSQFRVESMLLRLAHTQNYLAVSPGNQQVASQPAMECLPLVMEPESGFYVDPVVVLDFQSLYPSMMIAYNLCFSTCLGKVLPSKPNSLGCISYLRDPQCCMDLKRKLLLTPNGVMFVPPKVRRGVLPRLLEEILSTRIMVKKVMKKLAPSQQVMRRIFDARQLALKLIANVTYGYTAAGFSGRMPCAEIADSIVQCGRSTLETAISVVNNHDRWRARVIYGDTDSMFVLLKDRSVNEAFRIGNEIASVITAMNPNPVKLKMEKVYRPCFLLTKKRYVGYSYENSDQDKPIFDAKGIETVRRDTCPAVAKTLEQSIRLIFEHKDISKVRSYLERQWMRILSGRVSLQDFVFAKEVRLGTYSSRATSLPPAAIVATKAMRIDPRAEPHYGERVPYVVVHGEPGARLIDMVVDPSDLLDINSPFRLNDLYYINKQIIPALQRVFGLVGADLNRWFSEMPRPVRPALAKSNSHLSFPGPMHEFEGSTSGTSSKALAKRSRIDTYYTSKHCAVCGEFVQGSAYLCGSCSKKGPLVVTSVVGRASRLEREMQHLVAICRHCGGGDWIVEPGIKCTSLACSVYYERRKVQKELQALSTSATALGLYPSCSAEWF